MWALMCHLLVVKSVELRRLSEAEEASQALECQNKTRLFLWFIAEAVWLSLA